VKLQRRHLLAGAAIAALMLPAFALAQKPAQQKQKPAKQKPVPTQTAPAPKLSESTTSGFPDKAFLLTLGATQALNASKVDVTENGGAVTGLGMMIALATAGGRTKRLPIMDVALGVGAATGAVGAALYLRTMQKQRRWCAYCLVGASGMFALAAMTARGLARLTAA